MARNQISIHNYHRYSIEINDTTKRASKYALLISWNILFNESGSENERALTSMIGLAPKIALSEDKAVKVALWTSA
jgi:hypothetical protein